MRRRTLPDNSEETPYSEHFRRQTQKRIAERRAQDAADATVDWMSYSQAVHFLLPVLFGKDWIGPPSEQEQVVLKLGKRIPTGTVIQFGNESARSKSRKWSDGR